MKGLSVDKLLIASDDDVDNSITFWFGSRDTLHSGMIAYQVVFAGVF